MIRAALVLAALASCSLDDHPYACELDAQCGDGGRCEPEGYCAMPDTTCADTGYRFVTSAPAALASTCTLRCATDVAAGVDTTCVLLADRTVRCFGDNATGQLGLGTADADPHALPGDAAAGGRRFTQISVGAGHTCGRGVEGMVACWGANEAGQTGAPASAHELFPVDVVVGETVAAARTHTCSLGGGGVACWGANDRGQLGADDAPAPHTTPVTVRGAVGVLGNVTRIAAAAGADYTCAIASSVGCWGANELGQLGQGSITPRDYYEPIGNTSGSLAISAGSGHACASTGANGGSVVCWGDNAKAQLGNSDGSPHQLPRATTLVGRVEAIAAGGAHTCVIESAARDVGCFGDDARGQRGVEVGGPAYAQVAAMRPATSLAAGASHTCAIVDGRVYCWGDNTAGQLGDGTTTSRSTPRVAKLVCPRPPL